MIKVVSDKKYDEVLGVHMVGPHATELLAEACVALRLEITTEELAPHHPRAPDALGDHQGGRRGRPRDADSHLTPRARKSDRGRFDARPARRLIVEGLPWPRPTDSPLPQLAESTRKPEWLKVRMPHGREYERVKDIVRKTGLATVCEEARCPNIAECWGGGTATVMLMGEVCTRACRFCHVKVGAPPPLDPEEPENLARAVKALALEYIVVTCVNRDDRPDGGASHFAAAIRALKRESSADHWSRC